MSVDVQGPVRLPSLRRRLPLLVAIALTLRCGPPSDLAPDAITTDASPSAYSPSGAEVRGELATPVLGAAGQLELINPVHDLRVRFTPDAVVVTPTAANWAARWRLLGFGRSANVQAMPPVSPVLSACAAHAGCTQRVTYEHSELTEWYVNTVFGVEQRFDLRSRPAGSGPVVLRVGLETDLVVESRDGGETVALTRDGLVLMTLSKVRVWDAAGRRLAADLRIEENGVRYVIDDADAVWPLHVDPPLAACPASWCSDGDPSTLDVCSDGGASCTHVFDDSFEGQGCVWGTWCCPDGRFHADCSVPEYSAGQDCPDGWCNDGDPGTTDTCSAYRLDTGTFDCQHVFDAALDGEPCVWGKNCCADGRFHADCSDDSVAAGQDCPSGWCNDGDPTTVDTCSAYVPATGERTCTNDYDPASAGAPCTFGLYCCPDQTMGSPCDADVAPADVGGASSEPAPPADDAPDLPTEPDPEPTSDADPAPAEDPPTPTTEPQESCVVTMGDDGTCPAGSTACDLAFSGGSGCSVPTDTCSGVTAGKAYEVGSGEMLVIDANPGAHLVRLHYLAQPDSSNELRFLGANNKLIGQIQPMPCPSAPVAAQVQPRQFAFSEPVRRIVVASAVASVFLDEVSFGAQALSAGACGNGVLNVGEACDDGNAEDGDGCSAPAPANDGCAVEEGFICTELSCKPIIPPSASPAAKCLPDSCDANATCSVEDDEISCTCNPGFLGDGKTCDDVDECAANTDDCEATQKCTNLVGGFVCATCADGERPNSAGTDCEPCPVGTAGTGGTCTSCVGETIAAATAATACAECDANATANDAQSACTCNEGFSGDGLSCDATCGDGVLETGIGEECDDGNVVAGDGCSSVCKLEGIICASANFEIAYFEDWSSQGHGSGPTSWTLSADKRTVTQSENTAGAGVAVTNLPAVGASITFELEVETTSDDDFFGWIVGYESGDHSNTQAEFMLFDWKQKNQSFSGGSAARGLALSRVTGIPAATSFTSFWPHAQGVAEEARALTLGSVGWADNRAYTVRMEYTTTNIKVWVDDVLEFDEDGTYPTGNLGFYTFSQAANRFSLISPTSGEEVCGLDPDQDPDGDNVNSGDDAAPLDPLIQ